MTRSQKVRTKLARRHGEEVGALLPEHRHRAGNQLRFMLRVGVGKEQDGPGGGVCALLACPWLAVPAARQGVPLEDTDP